MASACRYDRQVRLPFIGAEGQARICASSAVVLGCGALGSAAANLLARAGVGRLRIVDRDFVEESNLQRQILFDQADAEANLPKAVAAERKLKAINPTIHVEGLIADAHAGNIEALLAGATVVVDGTDNFETRFLLNDACVKLGLPWVYGGAVGATGMSLAIVPGRTPCLRCVLESIPAPGTTATCDTVGILGGAAMIIGCYEATEALKICAGRLEDLNPRLFTLDLWTGEARQLEVRRAREASDCPCCKQRRFEFLEGRAASAATRLCGGAAVQINPRRAARLDLDALAKSLRANREVRDLRCNRFLLKFTVASAGNAATPLEIVVFADGRAIIHGTRATPAARAAYAKYVGT